MPGAPAELFQSPPEPLSRADAELRFFRVVPDLDLRRAAQVDAAVGLGHGLVVDHQLEVAVLLLRRQIRAESIVDQFAILNAPVLEGVFRILQPSWRARCSSVIAAISAGLTDAMPYQPVRSWPLNRAVKPAGGSFSFSFCAAALAAGVPGANQDQCKEGCTQGRAP